MGLFSRPCDAGTGSRGLAQVLILEAPELLLPCLEEGGLLCQIKNAFENSYGGEGEYDEGVHYMHM